MIKLQELQEQVLELPIKERWTLVQTVLASIQQETLSSISPQPTLETLSEADPSSSQVRGIRVDTLYSVRPPISMLKTLSELDSSGSQAGIRVDAYRVRPPISTLETLSELDPWTQSLIGVICLESENPEESYVNYLEEKYS